MVTPVSDQLHEWQCPSCGATTRARMADAPPPDSDQVRDEIARTFAAWYAAPLPPTQWQLDNGYDLADALLSGPVGQLLAERDRYAAQVQAVEALAEQWRQEAKRNDDAEPVNSDGLTRMILAARFLRMNADDLTRALAAPAAEDGER